MASSVVSSCQAESMTNDGMTHSHMAYTIKTHPRIPGMKSQINAE